MKARAAVAKILERGHSCPLVWREALWSVKMSESRGGQECPRSEGMK